MQTVTVISWQWLSVEFDVLSHQTEFVLFFFSVRYNLMNAKLKRVDPSVQCSENLMTLRVKGVRAPHILVDSGRFYMWSFFFFFGAKSLFKLFFANVKQMSDLLLLCPKCPLYVASL